MAQATHAHKGYFGVGIHATSLTDLRAAKVARTAFCRFHDFEVTHGQGEEVDPTSGRTDPEGVALGNYDVKAKGTLEGTTEGVLPYLARSLLGGQATTTTVGTTGKQHEFLVADTIPLNGGRLSCEARYGTATESETFNAVCDSMEFNINQAGYARWPVSLIGSSPALTGAPTAATLPSMSTILSQRVTTFTMNALTTKVVRNLSWKLQRTVPDDDYDVTSRQRRDGSYGEMQATFDAELTFQDSNALKEFWGGTGLSAPGDTDTYYPVNIKTERSDVIAGGTAKHTAMLDLPKAFITRVSTPMRGRDVIRQRIAGRGIYSPSGSVWAQKLTFINTVASYP